MKRSQESGEYNPGNLAWITFGNTHRVCSSSEGVGFECVSQPWPPLRFDLAILVSRDEAVQVGADALPQVLKGYARIVSLDSQKWVTQ